LKEGSSSGGPPDFCRQLRRPDPKRTILKGSVKSSLCPANAKEKPAGSGGLLIDAAAPMGL
jgi:hypothetical protein